MELPTYTNIWKIEKRLYKLYDFRLPMPLPVGQVMAFLAIATPYMLILTMVGMPFSHTWVWLYVLPPGVLAWLVTRPVLEGKRLPELLVSQLRYMSEPRTWCRMMPLAERDQIFVSATVWHRATDRLPPALPLGHADAAVGAQAPADGETPLSGDPDVAVETAVGPVGAGEPARAGRPVWPTHPAIGVRAVAAPSTRQVDGVPPRAPSAPDPAPNAAVQKSAAADVAASDAAAQKQAAQKQAAQKPAVQKPAAADVAASDAAAQKQAAQKPAAPKPAALKPTTPERTGQAPPTTSPRPVGRPTVTVRSASQEERPLPSVERALQQAPEDRPRGWHERVVVVPGGHHPGKPDQLQRDQARARLPLPRGARIVVLGCTAGAGQTTTTLLTGQLLANLRGEAVAVLDIGSGPGSLTEQARRIPRLLPGHRDRSGAAGSGRERGLQVVTADAPAEEPADAGRLIDAVVARYPITIADPAATHVPRAVLAADQLVLVAPANADAAGALAMTLEWLDAHGNADLARTAVTVLNGVRAATAANVDKAAAVAAGRSRALVRVPWDNRLADGAAVGIATIQAYTALCGVLMAGLAQPARADVRAGAGRS